MPLLAVVGLSRRFRLLSLQCRCGVLPGKLLGLTAKSHIPNYSEFYEARHFAPAPHTPVRSHFAGKRDRFGM